MPKNKIIISIIFLLISSIIINYDIISFVNQIKIKLGDYYYPLDDSYIHLSIAKNIAFHNNWGVTKYEFSNTSSSPFFTIILTVLFKLFGNNEKTPLYLNIFLCNLFLISIFLFFKKKPLQLLGIYLSLFFVVLLKIQVITGLEHVLHILIISINWLSFYKWIESENKNLRYLKIFFISIFLLIITRYESIFYIFPLLVYLISKKHYKIALWSLIISFLPMIIFGLYSIFKGSYFFPNSLLVKGNLSHNIILFYEKLTIIGKLILLMSFIFLFFSFLFILLSTKFNTIKVTLNNTIAFIKKNTVFLIIFLTIYFHSLFASFGWLYRYEAYLLALIIITIPLFLEKLSKNNFTTITLILLSFLFIPRYLESEKDLEFSNKNIFSQQVQLGKFLHKYFNNKTIIANDIGAICYYSEIKLIDIVGLGSIDILKARKQSPKKYREYLENINYYDLMIVYDSWFGHRKLKNREKYAELINTHRQVYGNNIVSFYVPKNSKIRNYIISSLSEFKKEIPKDTKLIVCEK